MIYRIQGRDGQGHSPVSRAQAMECLESTCPAAPAVCPLVAYECTRNGYKRETKFVISGSRALVFFRLQSSHAPPG